MEVNCKVCESSSTRQVGFLSLYSTGGDYDTNIFRCDNCGVFYRDFDYSDTEEIKSHFAIASYTALDAERASKSMRGKFFQHIVEISSHYTALNERANILDFGCAYGHLLEEYEKHDVNCFGVELDDSLRHRLEGRFSGMYQSLTQLPKDANFDIISFIDSFYYLENPIQILKEAKSRLRDTGVIMIRNTNRTFLLNLTTRYFPDKFSNHIFGDAKYNFSLKSMNIIFDKSGLEIEKIILHEKGKILRGVKRKFIYYAPLVISCLIPVKVTPGVIYIVKHKSKD